MDSLYQGINVGSHSYPAIFDINKDSLTDFVIGNKRGGLSFFIGINDSVNTSIINIKDNLINYELYPNPCRQTIQIKNTNQNFDYEILNLSGKLIKKDNSNGVINIDFLNNGIYFLKFTTKRGYRILKFVKCL